MKNENLEILKLPLIYYLIGIIGFLGVIIFGIQQLFTRESNQWIGIIIFVLIFGVLSLMIILLSKFYEIKISEKIITQRTIFGIEKKIMWSNIEKVSFNKFSLELTISDKSNKIKVHSHLNGFERVISEIERKTKIKRTEFGL